MNKRNEAYFWIIQSISWFLMGLMNIVAHSTSRPPAAIEALNTVSISVGGLVVTSAYRFYLRNKLSSLKAKGWKFYRWLFVSTMLATVAWFCFTLALFTPVFHKYQLHLGNFLPSIFNLFIITAGWTLLYLSIYLVKKYHRTEIEKWQLEAEMQKARLGALRSQINPHFMFNAINNIRALILEDPAAARAMLTSFAELLRYSLQYTEMSEIPVADELSILRRYFELLKIQYEEKIHFEITCPVHLKDERIPPMILQLLVENAVKHGISAAEKGGQIFVDIAKDENQLLMSVRNSGSMNSKNTLEANLGVGIKNITERLRLLYGDNAAFRMESNTPFVTATVTIKKND